MEWLVLVGIPAAGALGAFIGAWWSKRATDKAARGALLTDQLASLWSDEPRQRAAARETVQDLVRGGKMTDEQLLAASHHLKHWAAVNWKLSDEERRKLGG